MPSTVRNFSLTRPSHSKGSNHTTCDSSLSSPSAACWPLRYSQMSPLMRRSRSVPARGIWNQFVAAIRAPIQIPASLHVPPNELCARVAVCLWPEPEIVKKSEEREYIIK